MIWANRVAVPDDDVGELTGRDHTNLDGGSVVAGVGEGSRRRSQANPTDEEFDLPRMGLAWPSSQTSPSTSTSQLKAARARNSSTIFLLVSTTALLVAKRGAKAVGPELM